MKQKLDIKNEASISRYGEIREDSQKVCDIFYSNTCKIILIYKGNFICQNAQLQLFKLSELQQTPILQNFNSIRIDTINRNKLPNNTIYLGRAESFVSKKDTEDHLFVIPLDPSIAINDKVELLDSRSLAFSSSAVILEMLFYTQGLISWHFSHQFCAKCGYKTETSHSGHSRLCVSNDCNKIHFPRIEPAVIFSICRKASNKKSEDRILLARQSSWPEKRYSVIAGFAEHGENLEQTVAREAYEEVGLKVDNIHYLGSQPWPFPASLMIGFSCETVDKEIRLIDKELECAKWFTASEIKDQIESGELLTPFSISISWEILDHWYKQQTGQSIKSIHKTND